MFSFNVEGEKCDSNCLFPVFLLLGENGKLPAVVVQMFASILAAMAVEVKILISLFSFLAVLFSFIQSGYASPCSALSRQAS